MARNTILYWSFVSIFTVAAFLGYYSDSSRDQGVLYWLERANLKLYYSGTFKTRSMILLADADVLAAESALKQLRISTNALMRSRVNELGKTVI